MSWTGKLVRAMLLWVPAMLAALWMVGCVPLTPSPVYRATLKPETSTLPYFGEKLLTAEVTPSVPAGTELLYVYQDFGYSGGIFGDSNAVRGPNGVETTANSILYRAYNPFAFADNKVLVEVFRVEGGNRVFVARAEATIRVDEPVVYITPPAVFVNKNEYPILTCKVSGPLGPFTYKWTGKRISGEAGGIREFGTTNWLSSITSISADRIEFSRNSGIEGVLTVQVAVYKDSVEVGTSECTITLNRYSVAGTQLGYGERDANGDGGVFYGVDFPKIEGAWQYYIYGTGFNDPLVYGDYRDRQYADSAKVVNLRDRGLTYFYQLTGIGGNLGSKSTEDYVAEMAPRFVGGTWEVVPDFR